MTVTDKMGDLRSIFIDGPGTTAAYDIEIQDEDGDPVWGQAGVVGDQFFRLHDEGVRRGYTVLLSNATDGSYRVVVWRKS